MSRSYKALTLEDLRRLGELAAADRECLFGRKRQTGELYRNRLFAVALGQGAALHFLDGTNGINDFNVWSFFTESTERFFPYRRRGVVDLGDPKFGVSDDSLQFVGRRVDMIGRSLKEADPGDPIGSLRRYLLQGATKPARCLSQKAVILIEPDRLLGHIVWPIPAQQNVSTDANKRRG